MALKQKCCPLPKIQEMLSRCKGHKFLSKLDLLMQCCTFKLDKESKDLCATATPWGLFWCTRLPMGVSPVPSIAQEIMERVLALLLSHHVDPLGSSEAKNQLLPTFFRTSNPHCCFRNNGEWSRAFALVTFSTMSRRRTMVESFCRGGCFLFR